MPCLTIDSGSIHCRPSCQEQLHTGVSQALLCFLTGVHSHNDTQLLTVQSQLQIAGPPPENALSLCAWALAQGCRINMCLKLTTKELPTQYKLLHARAAGLACT